MDQLGLLLTNALLTAFGFFVAAPILLNAISTFTVQKRFAEVMVQEGVIAEAEVKRLQPKKQLAGVLLTVIVFAAAVFASLKIQYGPICLGGGFLGGLLKYRKIIQFNSFTVKRFQRTYPDCHNEEKLNKYIKKTF